MVTKIKSLVSIGMPVFNGEKFLEKSISSLLNQTYQNFELIISDNASTDKTPQICNNFAKKDRRIKYIRQGENFGSIWNFNLVLEKAESKYFMWASADDFWEPKFIAKNIYFLESNNEFVCSASLSKLFGDNEDIKKIDSKIQNFLLKIRFFLKPVKIHSLDRTFEENVREFLSKGHSDIMYGIFKRDVLKESVKDIGFGIGWGYAMLLIVLKFGKINVIDEILFWKYNKGISKSGMIAFSKVNKSILGRIFPGLPYTIWCFRNLGIKLFLKNFNYFIQVNFWVIFSMFVDGLKIVLKKILT